jgi:hypothetical protein
MTSWLLPAQMVITDEAEAAAPGVAARRSSRVRPSAEVAVLALLVVAAAKEAALVSMEGALLDSS